MDDADTTDSERMPGAADRPEGGGAYSEADPDAGLSFAESEVKLVAEGFEDFKTALDNLYIKNNMSGRLRFLNAYPPAATYILGAELIACDTEGTDDKERRAALEEEAEQRHIELLEMAETFEKSSVNNGALNLEYVEPLVQKLGRDLALLYYTPKIVDRIIAPPPAPEPEEPPQEEKAEEEPLPTPASLQKERESEEEKAEEEKDFEIIDEDDDPFSGIRPIDSD